VNNAGLCCDEIAYMQSTEALELILNLTDEVTSIADLMICAMSLKGIKRLDEIRQIAREFFPLETYQPQDTDQRDETYGRFRKVILTNANLF
jgi:hypothetical protein